MRNTDKTVLAPFFVERLNALEIFFAETKLPFHLFMGMRTWGEQQDLYEQGRFRKGPPCQHQGLLRTVGTCKEHPLGSKVTNAKAGYSWHNFGLAADYVLDGMPDKPGLQWSWDTKSRMFGDSTMNDWQELAEAAKALGLEAGFFWKTFPDLPHVQLTGGLDIVSARELYRETMVLDDVWNDVYHRIRR